jgi:hypothetical protein
MMRLDFDGRLSLSRITSADVTPQLGRQVAVYGVAVFRLWIASCRLPCLLVVPCRP